MNKTNYALMAALYDTEGAGLYQDIYFPIIRYSLTVLHSSQRNSEMYYDLGNLQVVITAKFGITIPLVVLKQCINLIGKKDNIDFSLTVYEKGTRFLVKKKWDVSINEDIESKLEEIENTFDLLESGFQKYLKDQVVDADCSFLDFVRDNSVDIYQYYEDGGSSIRVNENYYHISQYLNLLKVTHFELFNAANNIFWGSIIAGFLQRERDLNIKSVERVRYYLDTSLVMAVLDLSSEENVSYALELIDIIKASSGEACVHGLTLREVDSILYSVERSQKPYINSSIESAYFRRELTPTKIMQLRNKLCADIEAKGLIIDMPINDKVYQDICNQYRNNNNVRELRNTRNDNEDGFGAIHDIYITEFIKRKRGDNQTLEKVNCSFVSLNIDLMNFVKERYTGNKFPYIIHPSKIVMDLWIHNSKCISLKTNALPEVMSRCMALNNTDVRRKLRVVTKYNNNNTTFTQEDYVAVEFALINRSKRVISEIDAIGSSNDRAKADEHFRNVVRLAVEEGIKRLNEMALAQGEADRIVNNANEMAEQYRKIQEESLNKDVAMIEKDNKIRQLERLSIIDKNIFEKEKQLSELEKEKEASVTMIKFYMLISLEILGIVIILLAIIFWFSENSLNKIPSNLLNASAAISFLLLILKCKNLYLLTPKIIKHQIRDEQLKHWITANPKFAEIERELSALRDEKRRI